MENIEMHIQKDKEILQDPEGIGTQQRVTLKKSCMN